MNYTWNVCGRNHSTVMWLRNRA